MWSKFDQLSKGVLSRALAPVGRVATQHEIVGGVQAADVWFEPAAGPGLETELEAERARLGVLGRMAAEPCLIEPFHATPSVGDVLDCVNKQTSLRGMLRRASAREQTDAEASQQTDAAASQQSDATPWPDEQVPRLWILSAGRPERVMQAFELVPMDGWPPGFWQMPPSISSVHLVVVRDLPETRETLLLRLLGRGRTFERAMHELIALPEHAWERTLAIPQLVVAYRIESSQNSEEGMMNYADELQAVYDEWEARIKREGWEKGEQAGRLKTLQETLRRFYEARFGALPPDVQAALDATDDIDTLQQWIAPFATRTPEEIAALVRDRRVTAPPAP